MNRKALLHKELEANGSPKTARRLIFWKKN
jgi:hypothetical protein